MAGRIKIWGDPASQEDPFAQLFCHLLRVPEEGSGESPERLVTREKSGSERLWLLVGLDACPECGGAREVYTPMGAQSPASSYCRTCRVVEVHGGGGALLYRRSFEDEAAILSKALAESGAAPDGDEA